MNGEDFFKALLTGIYLICPKCKKPLNWTRFDGVLECKDCCGKSTVFFKVSFEKTTLKELLKQEKAVGLK